MITVLPFSTMVELSGRPMETSVEQAQMSMVVESWVSRQTGGGSFSREDVSVVHSLPDTLFTYLTDMLVMG